MNPLTPTTRTIFPGSNTVHIDKIIIEHLPIEDKLNLSFVNKRAWQILSNERFKEILEKKLINDCSDISNAFFMHHSERPPTYPASMKLNRAIQQIINTHPDFCYRLLCKILFNNKFNFKMPELNLNGTTKLLENFIKNVTLEIQLAENKNTKICGKGYEDPESFIHTLYLNKKAAEEKLNHLLQEENFLKAETYVFESFNTETANLWIATCNSFRKFLETSKETFQFDYANCLKCQEEFKKILTKSKVNIFKYINQAMCGKEQEAYTIYYERAHEACYLNLNIKSYEALEKIRASNQNLLENLTFTSEYIKKEAKPLKLFEYQHGQVLENIKDIIQLIRCCNYIEGICCTAFEPLREVYNTHLEPVDNGSFIVIEEAIPEIKNFINSCTDKTRKSIWETLHRVCAQGDIKDDSWAENNFSLFLTDLYSILRDHLSDRSLSMDTAYCIHSKNNQDKDFIF